MRKIKSLLSSEIFVSVFLLIIAPAAAYLPLVSQIGYSNDDWYLMYVAKAYGPQAFHAIFSVDRPLRAYLMIPAYTLFGENPLWYALSAYVFRALGGLALWWLLRMLWPQAKRATMLMALLFVIYPGFLSQTNAIDYQSHIVALALAVFSLALTVKALQATVSRPARATLLAASALTGWAYLGLMEYYIGFELIRFLLILSLAARSEQSWPVRLKKALLNWLPLAVVPFGFVFWRVFIFVGERKATDAGAQLSLFLVSPLRAMFGWAASLLRNMLEVLLMAWISPLRQLSASLDTWQILTGLGWGLLVVALTLFALKRNDDGLGDWRTEAFSLGLGSVVAGLIPVVLANRAVVFPDFSRYTLISSTGAVMVLVALIFWLPGIRLRRIVLSALLLIAITTHYANSVKAVRETASMDDFWWQVAWRIPMLEKNTTLVAQYPLVAIQEDYFVWGPANLIYYPEKLYPKDIQPGLYAALPVEETAGRVLAREPQQYDKRRMIITYANYRNILILIQPSTGSCVRVIDGLLPEISSSDGEIFKQMAPFSEMEHAQVNAPQPVPPVLVFGPEPEHGWCYYYQKASLARQQGDWDEVRRLGNEVRSKNLYAANLIEWVPFIQAYALADDREALSEISSGFRSSLDATACKSLAHPQIPAETLAGLEQAFCRPVQ